MRLTITVEDAAAPAAQTSVDDDRAGRPADLPAALDGGAAQADGTAGTTPPAASGADDGGQAPSWLVELLDGLGAAASVGEPAGTDAGTAPVD